MANWSKEGGRNQSNQQPVQVFWKLFAGVMVRIVTLVTLHFVTPALSDVAPCWPKHWTGAQEQTINSGHGASGRPGLGGVNTNMQNTQSGVIPPHLVTGDKTWTSLKSHSYCRGENVNSWYLNPNVYSHTHHHHLSISLLLMMLCNARTQEKLSHKLDTLLTVCLNSS